MQNDPSFFRFQERVGRILTLWGAGSVLVGSALAPLESPVLRQIGIQSLIWGAIDAAIGEFGQRSARKNSERQDVNVAQQARRFRTIVLVNTLLDVGYVAGGAWLLRSANGHSERTGAGIGVIIQGAFLLVFDATLTWLSGRWVDSAD